MFDDISFTILLQLKDHFKLMDLCPDSKLVSVHVLFFLMASNSFCVASCHIVSVATSQ